MLRAFVLRPRINEAKICKRPKLTQLEKINFISCMQISFLIDYIDYFYNQEIVENKCANGRLQRMLSKLMAYESIKETIVAAAAAASARQRWPTRDHRQTRVA